MNTLIELFQGIGTMLYQDWTTVLSRISLILLGGLLVYLGKRGTLEPLLMIPMGLGMIAINAGVLFLDPQTIQHSELPPTANVVAVDGQVKSEARPTGNLIIQPLVKKNDNMLYFIGLDFLQPIYSFTFSNGLVACLVFLGIGVLLDVGFLLARPMESMFLALCGELGTILTFPIAVSFFHMTYGEAASVAMIGGADGPMVMFTTLKLAPHLFVPITVVGYLYLSLTYGGYPYLIKFLVPKHIRATKTFKKPVHDVPSGEKLSFAVVACAVLCGLFPMAAPLFLSLFLGVAVRESQITVYIKLIDQTILYLATLMLGLTLGVLCSADVIFETTVLKLLVLGIIALLISGIGALGGGYVLYFMKGRQYNPVIGIAAVSCVPTTAKVAQKIVQEDAPGEIILPEALGANISGVITTAILCGAYVALVPILEKALQH